MPGECPTCWRPWPSYCPEGEDEAAQDLGEVRLALLGRPNVGKSSLINRLTGQERVVVSDVPGTTRDAVDTPWRWMASAICSSTPRASAARAG